TAWDRNKDPQVRLWDLASGQSVGPPMRHSASVDVARFSPDGRAIVSGSSDGSLRLWDAATGAPRCEARPLGAQLPGVAISPDGGVVAAPTGEGTIGLRSTADGSAVPGAPLRHREGVTVTALAFSPDGKLLAAGYDDGCSQLWDLRTHRPLGAPVA